MTQSYHARLAATALRPISWGAARPCGSERALGNIIDGPWQVGAIAGRPAHDHWTTRPSSGSIEPTIACDDCTFVERLQAGALVMRRGFFFDGPTGGRVSRPERSDWQRKPVRSMRFIPCRTVPGSSAALLSPHHRRVLSPSARSRTQNTPRDRIPISKASSLQSHRQMGVVMRDCNGFAILRSVPSLRRANETIRGSDTRRGTCH
jgi:hypothetical protein